MLYIVASVLALVWLCKFLFMEMKKPKNFPRGPFFYPIIGNALTLKKAREECGMLVKGIRKIADRDFPNEKDLIAFKVGKDRICFTLSTKAVVDTYMNTDLDGRPNGAFFETRTFNMKRGIIMTEGEFFTVQNRFVVRRLKEFGFARSGMKEICENEAEHLLDDFRKRIAENGGKCMKVTMPNIHGTYVLNSIWKFMAGIRYNPDNEELALLQDLLNDLFKSIDQMGAAFSHFPILCHVAPEASGYNQFVRCHENLYDFFRKEVENHKRNFNPTDDPNDLIEAYLRMLYSGDDDESGQIHESFSELQLLAILLDVFMAGSETTMKTLNFMFLYLIRNTSIQKKARREIDKVVGRNRLPKLEDRVNLPYCEAIVNEALRFFNRYTCGIPHRAMRDTKLCGFDIPKDTWVVVMFQSLMEDENVYKHQDGFNPENFLNDEGKLAVPDKHCPFGLGKRRCIGEVLSKSNLFLMLTTLLQNFYFEVPLGHDLPSDEPVDGLTATVHDYEAFVILRN